MATQMKTEKVSARIKPDTLEKIKAMKEAGVGSSMSEIIEKAVDLLCESSNLKLFLRRMTFELGRIERV